MSHSESSSPEAKWGPSSMSSHDTDNMMPFITSKKTVEPAPIRTDTMATLSSLSTRRVGQAPNEDGPEHQYQINQTLLYEHEFRGHTYVSAHLQRLQNGIFAHDNLHTRIPMHVTFVALTFTLHPSVSAAHRFTSAVVEITAKSADTGEPLRFIKYAPHLAYGRISSETLKWSFQLGAALGVTQGPVNLSVNPSGTYEKEKVQGTMMKIQGSTRSQKVYNKPSNKKRIPDTKLVWSLEENKQQETGLPREFTFVFLIERPGRSARAKKSMPSKTKSVSSVSFHSNHEDDSQVHVVPMTESAAHHEADVHGHVDHDATFGRFTIGIAVKPQVSGTMPSLLTTTAYEETDVDEEVGQKLLPVHTGASATATANGRVDSSSKKEGYFNFANMKQDFEGLIELPGNAITTKEPTLGV